MLSPNEPLVRVMFCKPTEKPKPKPPPAAVQRRPAADTVMYGGGPYGGTAPVARRISLVEETEELRRRIEWLGPDVPVETILENMRRELRAVSRR